MTLLSCSNEFVENEQQLNAYVQDEANGLLKISEKKDIRLGLYNKPTDLLVAQEFRQEIPTDSLIESLRKKYDDYLYFILNISRSNEDALYTANSYAGFSELLQNMSFRMMNYVEMVTSEKDTIPLADSHYSRLYGMAGSTSVMLVFNKEKLNRSEWVQVKIDDFGLNTGRTFYRFNSRDLLSAPKIKFINPTQ